MGRIKTKMIKRAGEELIRRFGDVFTVDFETNKRILNEMDLNVSKKVRNKIAGYITRKIKIRSRE